jgi:hypothetical protein
LAVSRGRSSFGETRFVEKLFRRWKVAAIAA